MKKISTTKRFVALFIAAVLVLVMVPTMQVKAAAEFTAEFGAYMDDSVNSDVGSWPDMSEFGGTIAFNAGEEATITLTFPAPVAFNGPYAAINTDFPIDDLGFAQITSLRLDGEEIPLEAQFINDEGIDGGVRLTISNTWNGDIQVQPVDLTALPEFTTMEVSFIVSPPREFTAEFGAYLDDDVNADVGSWPDMSEYGGTITFSAGQEATITLTFPAPVAFNGPYAAINTNFPIDDLGFAQITSLRLDGENVPLVAQFINDEGIDGGVRLTISNTWNGDIEIQPVDLTALPEFTTMEVSFIIATAGDFTAEFGAYLNDDVNPDVGSWPDMSEFGGTISFSAGEEARITLNFPAPVAFNGPYAAINTDFPFTSEVDAEILSLRLDGVEFPLAAQFINQEGLGDPQGVRLTLSNTWNGDIEIQPIDLTTLPEFTTLDVIFIIHATGGTAFVAAPVELDEFDPYGTFYAYMGIQTELWTFRNSWTESSYGLHGSGWDAHDIGNNFMGLTGWDDGEAVRRPGEFTDAVIAGNGRYRVSLTGFDFADSTFLRMMFVSTNIPNTGDVEISNVRVVTGRAWENDAEFRIPADTPYMEIHVLNQHDNFEVFNNAIPEPGGEMYIEFTINGFAFGEATDEGDAEPEVFAPTPVEQRDDVPEPITVATADDDGGFPVWAIVLIIVGAVVIAGVVVVFVVKKKK